MDDRAADRLASILSELASQVGYHAHAASIESWHVSARNLELARALIEDTERRLRNGDDIRG